MFKKLIIQPNSWLKRVGGRWETTSGIDVTKFLWSKDKKFWFWISQMPEELVEILMPQIAVKYTQKKVFHQTVFETNMYRARMVHKLAKYAEKNWIYEYNNLLKILTRNSKSFRAWIYDSTTNFKARDLSPSEMLKAHIRLQKMVRGHGTPKFRFKRVWIPKADGTLRPLAVPNLEDRWLAKAFHEWTLIWLKGTKKDFHPNQFGSISGRSTAQAWNKVIKDIIPKKFVLEFDVAKCYDTMSWDGIWMWMRKCDFPQSIHNYILMTITSAGRNLPKEEYRAELNRMRRVKLMEQTDLWNIGQAWDTRFINQIAGKLRVYYEKEYLDKWERWEKLISAKVIHAKIQNKLGIEGRIEVDQKDMPLEIQHRLKIHAKDQQLGVPYGALHLFENRFNRLEVFDCGLGIPQGWALSPLLCNYQIKAAFKPLVKAEWVTYLDDGVIGADSIEDLKLNELIKRLSAVGLRIHPSKTKLNKEDGVWKHDVKFLGALLRKDGKFLAATRKGATQLLTTPPTTLSGEGIIDAPWNEHAANFIKEVKLDEAQLAWIYNNGGIFDANGDWTPVNVGKMWSRSWNSNRMTTWKQRNPELANQISDWLRREETNLNPGLKEGK